MTSQLESLSSKSNQIQKNGNSFNADFDMLFVEEGFNIRDVDQEHIIGFRSSWINNIAIPALTVEVVNGKLKVIDGHHRYYGYKVALASGKFESKQLSVIEFMGNEVEKLALMIKSSEGRPLSTLERAGAYQRMIDGGASQLSIAESLGEASNTVSNLVRMYGFIVENSKFRILVENKILSTSKIISYLKNYDDNAHVILSKEINFENLDIDSIKNKPSGLLDQETYAAEMKVFDANVAKVKKQIRDSLINVTEPKLSADSIENMSDCISDLGDALKKAVSGSEGKTVSLKIDKRLALEILKVSVDLDSNKLISKAVHENRKNMGLDSYDYSINKKASSGSDKSSTVAKSASEAVSDIDSHDDLNNPDINIDPFPAEDENQDTYSEMS